MIKSFLIFLLVGSFATATASAKIKIPGVNLVPAQNNAWSCGPNALARIFGFYGYKDITYELLQNLLPRSFKLGDTEFGPVPIQIAATINGYAGSAFPSRADGKNPVSVSYHVNLDEIFTYIDTNVPVMALLQGEVVQFFGFNFPTLHYVIPVDYTINQQGECTHLTYMDSDGLEKTVSIDTFKTQWLGLSQSKWKIDFATSQLQTAIVTLRKFGAEIYENKGPLQGGTLIVPLLPKNQEKTGLDGQLGGADEGKKRPDLESKSSSVDFSPGTQLQSEGMQLVGSLKDEMNNSGNKGAQDNP